LKYLIYLDVCCLNRPFDLQEQERVRLETEAILLILSRCQNREWLLLGSEAIDNEVSHTPDPEKQEKIMLLAALAITKVNVTKTVESRARELIQLKFKTYDALHIACAEEGSADIFLTTDDRLVNKAAMYDSMLKVKLTNPIFWLLEVTSNGN
jgi:predicted nucleic acid-binding protein